jgi:hypothetical protein
MFGNKRNQNPKKQEIPAQIVVLPGSRGPNPNIQYGQEDMNLTPVMLARYATPWNMVQLSNGVDRGDQGMKDLNPASSYLANVVPLQPGQTRVTGTNPADFPQMNMAPAQWAAYVQATAGLQPQYGSGVGTSSAQVYNPGSAGA